MCVRVRVCFEVRDRMCVHTGVGRLCVCVRAYVRVRLCCSMSCLIKKSIGTCVCGFARVNKIL